MLITEGVFRKPRLRTNVILKRFASLFEGSVVNVSASNDSDKDCSFFEYYFGDYDSGKRYKEYFTNASSYSITNYPNDETHLRVDEDETIPLDLEAPLPSDLEHRFDVVLNHTVLEHVFDIFSAFANLCRMSRDIVIVIVPQFQQIHDYHRGYADYWRFTPFAMDKLFEANEMTVLYRETTHGFSESQYLLYIATKHPERWQDKFPPLPEPREYLNRKIDGSTMTSYSAFVVLVDGLIRRVTQRIGRLVRRDS